MRYRAALVALAFARTGDREAAEDVAQEVLLKAWQRLPSLEDPAAFAGWLRAIGINACRDWYRRGRPWERWTQDLLCLVPEAESRPLEVVMARERDRALRRALSVLPVDNQRALLMRVWGGYSTGEIAAFLGVPVTTVEGRIHRAKDQLRRSVRVGLLREEELGRTSDEGLR